MITEYDEAQKRVEKAELHLAKCKRGRTIARVSVTLGAIVTPLILLAALKLPALGFTLLVMWVSLGCVFGGRGYPLLITKAEYSLEYAKLRLSEVSTKIIEEFNA